jgi:DNA-binding protein YbaB
VTLRPEWQAHIDEMLGQYRRLRDNVGRMQRELADLTATVQSPDGAVRATVGPRGELLKLEINPRAQRALDSVTLAEVIVATARKAGADVAMRMRQVVEPNLPDSARVAGMGADIDFTKMFPEDPVQSHHASEAGR